MPPKANKQNQTQKQPLTDVEILADIMTRPMVSVWPHLGWIYKVGREKAYEIAGRA
jgi:hypothetical protein